MHLPPPEPCACFAATLAKMIHFAQGRKSKSRRASAGGWMFEDSRRVVKRDGAQIIRPGLDLGHRLNATGAHVAADAAAVLVDRRLLDIGPEHALGLAPVSYTHLDVYKRQAILLAILISWFSLGFAGPAF